MNTCQFKLMTYKGFNALELANDTVRLVILPELGGKIASIQYVPAGYEWLWHNPHLTYKTPEYDTSYLQQGDTGGLDECFPTVAITNYPVYPWHGTPIPDHGELWCQAWETVELESAGDRVVWTARCHGVRLPYTFERTLTLSADYPGFDLHYRVVNPTAFPMPFVWSIHPLLKISAGMRLTLPDGIRAVRGSGAVDLDTLLTVPPVEYAQAAKLYVELAAGSEPVETTLTDGPRSLSFRFVPEEITHVGLWLNYGGWSGLDVPAYYNLGLEPCIGGADALDEAYAAGPEQCGIVPPKAERRWSLNLRLS